MIYITGDTHGYRDILKLSHKNFNQIGLTKNDYVIITGDFGLIWEDKPSKAEEWWLEWLEQQAFTTLFIDGNHENHTRLNEYPISLWKGGKIHKITDSVIHLMRGQVFEIDGKKIFTLGGANSYDKQFRTDKISWWEEELPTLEELGEAIFHLAKNNWKVDYIITHCASYDIEKTLFTAKKNRLTSFLNIIYKMVDFKKAYCGHYHLDKELATNIECIYQQIVEIEGGLDECNESGQR